MNLLATAFLAWLAIAVQEPRQTDAPIRSGWLIHPLPQGAELRFLPPVVTLKDYPKKARRAGNEGTSLLSLQLDPSGHLVGCTTVKSSGSPVLDEQACRLYRKRGRFELRGTNQLTTVQAPVRWVLTN